VVRPHNLQRPYYEPLVWFMMGACLQLTFEQALLTPAHDLQLKYCVVDLEEKGTAVACQKKLDLHTYS